MMNCAKCKQNFALVSDTGKTKVYQCACPRIITASTETNSLEARIEALEDKVNTLEAKPL